MATSVSSDETTGTIVSREDDPASAGITPEDAANSDWITQDAAGSTTIVEAAAGNLVVVVGADGIVRSVIDKPAENESPYPDQISGQPVDAVWPADIAKAITTNCRRALRSRQVRSEFVSSEALGRDIEMIFIVQGRDSVMLVMRDVTHTRARISRLERLAFEDKVTGLPNREWLMKEFETILQRLKIQGGRAAVIALEIGSLDVLRDLAPNVVGDGLMVDLAKRMKNALRGTNRNDECDDERYSVLARIDETHFAILLPRIETGDDAAAVTNRIVELLEAPVTIDDKEVHVNVAAGIALYPQDGRASAELFASAVTAMQDAKHSATQQQRFHSGTMRMRALEREDLEHALRSAVENEEFALTFLPIVTADMQKTAAVEALLRWPKSLFGAKPISEVVAAAEYTGLIFPIGEWVFANACRQVAEWRRGGASDLRIAINVSAQEFSRGKLVQRTERLLGETGVEPRAVIIEITEQLLFRDSINDFTVCRGLKELGIDISVDDYGTGICSFDHLSRSPVDSVKIHPDIVARANSGAPGRAACAAVTAMAHALGIRVVAEGVETDEQANLLTDIGCDYLQGFLFSRPVDDAALIEYLQASKQWAPGEVE